MLPFQKLGRIKHVYQYMQQVHIYKYILYIHKHTITRTHQEKQSVWYDIQHVPSIYNRSPTGKQAISAAIKKQPYWHLYNTETCLIFSVARDAIWGRVRGD